VSQIPLNLGLNLAPERKTWSVSELTARIKALLEGNFSDVWVEGEISNFKAAQSGHLYFTLKDAKAQIRCVCFRNHARLLKFKPEHGLHITVRGSLGVYEQRGEYQIYVEHIEPVGLGALQLAFEQLKAKLAAEGLFDAARKKALPLLPRRIGIVTSPTGAAVRDILRILRRRFPNAHAILFPVRVQGDEAAGEIAAALKYFGRAGVVDVIILARGGGSLEDLWAFNEEVVARAIAAAEVPVISGVGHETDFTISDFVADVRAPTPSAAAEIVVRTRQEFDRQITEMQRRMLHRARYLLLEWSHRLQELLAHPGLRRPQEMLRQSQLQADELAARLAQALATRVENSRQRFTVAATRLASFDLRGRIRALAIELEHRVGELGVRIERALTEKRRQLAELALKLDERSPLRVLERGYAIVYDAAGNVVRSAGQVALGETIAVQLSRGKLAAEVKRKEEGK